MRAAPGTWPRWPAGCRTTGDEARLFAADLDNNGGIDLIGSGSSGGWIVLGDGAGGFRTIAASPGLRVSAVADLNGDGRLDLAGLSREGRPVRGIGTGTKELPLAGHPAPRARRSSGDGRINSFGVGGEVEVRAGLLVQKQVIAGPIAPLRPGRAPDGRRRPHRLAQRDRAGRVRRQGRPGDRRRAAAQGLVPVPVRLRRDRDAVRDRLHLALAARPSDQRAGHGRRRRRPRTGSRSAATSSPRATAITTSASPPNSGRPTSSTTSR